MKKRYYILAILVLLILLFCLCQNIFFKSAKLSSNNSLSALCKESCENLIDTTLCNKPCENLIDTTLCNKQYQDTIKSIACTEYRDLIINLIELSPFFYKSRFYQLDDKIYITSIEDLDREGTPKNLTPLVLNTTSTDSIKSMLYQLFYNPGLTPCIRRGSTNFVSEILIKDVITFDITYNGKRIREIYTYPLIDNVIEENPLYEELLNYLYKISVACGRELTGNFWFGIPDKYENFKWLMPIYSIYFCK